MVAALAVMLNAAGADGPVLPPAKELLPKQETLGRQLSVYVRSFRFEGNTVFPDAALAAVLKDYVDRTLISEELEQARRALTLHYVHNGYINSGAVLPDQDVAGGVVTFRIVEGELSEVTIRGNRRTASAYVRPRVMRGIGTVLNLDRLKQNLEILRQSPLFERVEAKLQPGTEPGQSRLDLELQERQAFQAAVEFANDQSPAVGAERVRLLLGDRNLTGYGDDLEVRYGVTTGGLKDMRFACFDDVRVAYTVPVTPFDTTLSLAWERTDSLLVESPFSELDITSETQSYSVGLRQPLYRTPNTELAVSLTGQRRGSQTRLLGRPFSFEPGADRGRTVVSVLRFGQEWVTRDERQVTAARSTFTFGLPAMRATRHDDLPDGQFFAWLGQAQHVHRLGVAGLRAIARLSAQLSNDKLLSLEQFGIGGMNTVRGYRENQIVRDNGLVASAELRLPVVKDPGSGEEILQVAGFVDLGHGWNESSSAQAVTMCSAGLGLLLHLGDRVDGEIYWGAPFRHFDEEEENLQDWGIHFRLLVRAF